MTWSSLGLTATEAFVGRIQDRIFRAAKIKRPRLEPDDEQSSCPVLRGLGSGNGARLPDYAYGKSETRIEIVEGRARKSYGHGRPLEEWEVLLKDHHEGYIDWGEFNRNQAQLASNAYGLVGGPKSGRGGSALLSGLITCGR